MLFNDHAHSIFRPERDQWFKVDSLAWRKTQPPALRQRG